MACEAVNYNAGKMIVFAQFTIAGSWEIAAMVQRDAEVKVIEITPNLNHYELTPTENRKVRTQRIISVRIADPKPTSTLRWGLIVSSATLATPSMARKNQMANGNAAKMPVQPLGKLF